MKRFFSFVVAAALALAPASAQSPQVRALLLGVGKPAAAASSCAPNACPGDIAGWGAAYAAYSLRCFKFSYAGNVAHIRNVASPSTATILTCSGGIVNETINPLSTTCASSCEIDIWYDQSGSGTGCNLSTASGGGLPLIALVSFAGQPSPSFSGGSLLSCSANATAQLQPISIAAAVIFTGTGEVFTDGTFGFQPLASLGANGRSQQAGGSLISYTGIDSTLEAIISVVNGASSSMKINGGSITSNGDPGPNGIANTNKLTIGAVDAGGAFFNGNIYEVIVVAGAKNSTEQNAIVANQRTIGTGW